MSPRVKGRWSKTMSVADGCACASHVGVDVAQDGTGLVVVAVGDEGAVQLAACRALLLGNKAWRAFSWRMDSRLVLEMPRLA